MVCFNVLLHCSHLSEKANYSSLSFCDSVYFIYKQCHIFIQKWVKITRYVLCHGSQKKQEGITSFSSGDLFFSFTDWAEYAVGHKNRARIVFPAAVVSLTQPYGSKRALNQAPSPPLPWDSFRRSNWNQSSLSSLDPLHSPPPPLISLTLSLSVQSPPPVLHPFPQAHIARNPITSHEGKASLIPPPFNLLLLKLLFLSLMSSYFLSPEVKGRSPNPSWAFAHRRVTLSRVSVTSWPLPCGPWVPGVLYFPTLNSVCVDTVLVVPSRFYWHTAGEAWMMKKAKAKPWVDGWWWWWHWGWRLSQMTAFCFYWLDLEVLHFFQETCRLWETLIPVTCVFLDYERKMMCMFLKNSRGICSVCEIHTDINCTKNSPYLNLGKVP